MHNQRFRDLPLDKVILPLNFVPDEAQMEEWLNALNGVSPKQAAEKILQAIGAFEHGEIKTSLKIKLLFKIYQHLPVIVQELQKSYVDSSLPLGDRAVQDVELVVWMYMQLARGFRQCKLKHANLGKAHQAGLLFVSLEALMLALLHISLSYKVPMHGFWALIYELYARAEQAYLTKIEITWGGRKGQNIANIFKQLLIFYLCDTRQFRSRDILTLFDCLFQYTETARILVNYQTNWQSVVCVFNLNKDYPPQKINAEDSRDDLSERFITTVDVAKDIHLALQQQTPGNNALRSLNYEVMSRALNALGLTRRRRFTRIFEKNEFNGLVGFNNLIDYLSLKIDLKVIVPNSQSPKPSSQMFDRKPQSRFSLVPVGEESVHSARDAVKHNEQLRKILSYALEKPLETKGKMVVTQESPDVKRAPMVCKFEMQDSSAKGYGLLTQQSAVQFRVGDVIAIIAPKSERIEVGFIRRINPMSNQYLHLGVEIIGFEAELVFVSSAQQPRQGCLAILLPSIKSLKQPDSLIYNSSLFKQGDKVEIFSQHGRLQFCMQKSVQMTLATTHMELSSVT